MRKKFVLAALSLLILAGAAIAPASVPASLSRTDKELFAPSPSENPASLDRQEKVLPEPLPAEESVCQTSYCREAGIRCINFGTCGGGSCLYSCDDDPSCTAPDTCPANACSC